MLNLEPHELKLLLIAVRDYQLALLKLANTQRRPSEAIVTREDASILNDIGGKLEAAIETNDQATVAEHLPIRW